MVTWNKLLLFFFNGTGMVPCLSFGNCDDGWVSYGSSCYLFADINVHFTEAEHYCRQHGGHLVTVESSTENNFLATFAHRLSGDNYWLGLTDETAEGVWKWSNTGSQATFTNWSPGEPNNDHNQDCAQLLRNNGKWDDTWCTSTNNPLCEKSKPAEVVGWIVRNFKEVVTFLSIKPIYNLWIYIFLVLFLWKSRIIKTSERKSVQ